MRKITQLLRVYATSGLVLLGSALPAQATDIVPFVGLRFGGDVGTQQGNGVAGPTSVTIDSSVSYGGVIDIPLSQPRSVELYYSRQPTKLSGNSTIGDVTMSVLHVGLVDTLPSVRLSFLAATAARPDRALVSAAALSGWRPNISVFAVTCGRYSPLLVAAEGP